MEQYDAIVIGAGHNGLIAAAYLAGSGKRTLVLERRPVVGGAAVTEEHFPGYHLSTCSYVCSLLLPEVVEDLDLVEHGYDVRLFEPQIFAPMPDGRYFMSTFDDAETKRQISKFSAADAKAWDPYWEHWERIIQRARPLLLGPAPTLAQIEDAFQGPEAQDDLRLLLFGSVADILNRYFESDVVKGALCGGGVIGSSIGPYTPGSAYVKFHHLLGNIDGRRGTWGYVQGGMGGITQALASVCRSRGVEIVTDACVEEIDVTSGRASGVRLADGRRFEANLILSNADSQRTFLDMLDTALLPDAFVTGLQRMKVKGSVVKVLIGLGELPNFTALPGTEIGPQHTGGIMISPSMEYVERAYDDTKYGRVSQEPFMDCYIQTATEDDLAPDGKHTLSLFVQYAPYELAEGTWDSQRDAIGQRIVETFATYAPNLPGAIEQIKVLGPPDIEAEIGITGGNIFHGEITPDQMFSFRPVPGFSSYESPIEGLYLCGSSAWPGGGVFGAPGRNCALDIIASHAD